MVRRPIPEPPYSGFLLAFEPGRTARIAEQLDTYLAAVESFSSMDWEFKRRELVLLSLVPHSPSVSGLALMERMHGSGGTAKFKMRIHEPVLFEPIPVESLRLALGMPQLSVSTAERLQRIDPATWTNLIAAIKTLRPPYAEQIDALLIQRAEDRRLIGEGTRVARLIEQRDALGIALDMANMDRKETFRSISPRRVSDASSVLDLLDWAPLHEQDVLRYDQKIFMELLDDSSRSVRITGKDGVGVRIHVYDKKPLETVLGTDLLIYQEKYRSFLLIQYKNMEQIRRNNGRTWSYLIDQQIMKQIDAMNRGRAAILRQAPVNGGIRDWRLHVSPFYFKFCETTRPTSADSSLIRGIILQLEHLEQFLGMKESESPDGGRRVGYDNCPRYLNNTQFVELAREGWIGCDQQGYALIRDLLEVSRSGGRQAMLAVIEETGPLTATGRGWRHK